MRPRVAREGGRPNSSTLPAVGWRRPSSSRMRVVLPAPLAPSSPTTSPARTSRSTPATAVNAPKRRTAPSASGQPRRACGRRGAPAPSAPAAPARRGLLGERPREDLVRVVPRAPVLEEEHVRGALRLVEVGGGDDHGGARRRPPPR